MSEKSPLVFLLSAGAAPQFKVIRWTPEMAEYAFKNHNTHQNQRSFSQAIADKYCRTMQAGQWRAAWPQCVIAFSVGGVLLNGQKTLWAIWKSGITIEICTQWNVPESDFVLYDDFQSRSACQLSRQAGLNHVVLRNAVAKMVMSIDGKLGQHVRVTVNDVVTHTVDDALMNTCLVFAVGHRAIKTSESAVTYALYKIALVHGFDAAASFWQRTCNGVNLTADDPRLHLKRFLTNRKTNTWDTRNQATIGIIKAFNAWMMGSPMHLLGVKNTETIPDVVGTTLNYGRSARSRTA